LYAGMGGECKRVTEMRNSHKILVGNTEGEEKTRKT